jgi:transposase
MGGWIDERANQRHHRGLGCRPIQRWDADRAAMLPLPPIAPVVGWRVSVRLPRDYYVRIDSNDYSVHPSVIGRRVEVSADLARVTVTCGSKVVADHLRCWADHQTITDPEHAAAAEIMRRSRSKGLATEDAEQVQQRPLSDYDQAFGLNEQVA